MSLPKAGPWATRQEYLVDQALESALALTDDQLRVMRPVASPQQLFPMRTGFQASQWTIEEVLNIDRRTPTYRSWVSGAPVMTRILSDYSFSGSARNAMMEGAR
jgi:hypothetical protein